VKNETEKMIKVMVLRTMKKKGSEKVFASDLGRVHADAHASSFVGGVDNELPAKNVNDVSKTIRSRSAW
jgi:hypothetical protein